MAASKTFWACNQCTFHNSPSLNQCKICNATNSSMMDTDFKIASELHQKWNGPIASSKFKPTNSRKRTYTKSINNQSDNNIHTNSGTPRKKLKRSYRLLKNNRNPIRDTYEKDKEDKTNTIVIHNPKTYSQNAQKEVFDLASEFVQILSDIKQEKILINNEYNPNFSIMECKQCKRPTKDYDGDWDMDNNDNFYCNLCWTEWDRNENNKSKDIIMNTDKYDNINNLYLNEDGVVINNNNNNSKKAQHPLRPIQPPMFSNHNSNNNKLPAPNMNMNMNANNKRSMQNKRVTTKNKQLKNTLQKELQFKSNEVMDESDIESESESESEIESESDYIPPISLKSNKNKNKNKINKENNEHNNNKLKTYKRRKSKTKINETANNNKNEENNNENK
eukprot:273935_1